MSTAMICQDDAPKLYAVHLVKNGPRCPVKVWYGFPTDPDTGETLDRSPRWHVILNGEFVEPTLILMLVGNVGYVKGKEIDQAEYDYMLRVREWALQNDAPEAKPREAIDLKKLPTIF